MKLGNANVNKIRLGSTQMKRVYLGSDIVWQNAPTAIAATGVGTTSFTANWEAYSGAVVYYLDVSEFSDFSTFVYENEIVYAPNTSYVVIGVNSNTTYYYRVRASDVDPDAEAFFARVDAATGVPNTLSTTEKSAINQLVLGMKNDGIWTKMKAIYPMVGGGNPTLSVAQAACSQNLKSSSFTATFTATGWTFANTGITGDGTSAYMDTNLRPNIEMNFNSQSYFIYKTGIQAVSGLAEFGVTDGANGVQLFLFSGYATINEFVFNGQFPSTQTSGAYILNRNNSSDKKLFQNGVLYGTRTSSATNYNLLNIYLAARNTSGTAGGFTMGETRFFSLGDGLTDGEAGLFYTAVQNFQVTLNRAVI